MFKILVASNNSHKVKEIKYALKDISKIKIYSFKDLGVKVEVTEDGNTLEKNAYKKAKEVFNVFKIPSISDDTGLFTDALNGEPGVFSARYSGEDATYVSNCSKLLEKLEAIPFEKRTAYFETVICFYINEDNYHFFRGICKGNIDIEMKGKNGFGYDPLFVPEGFKKSFAEMKDEEKNKISHRALALNNFADYIRSNY